MPDPTVSVIMSVYNGEKFIERSINSILNQSFKDFEFIIIDDGSEDSTLEILNYYSKKDRRIKVIRQQNNGLTKSLNRGILLSKGKYIARQDSDDISHHKRLEIQLGIMENTDYDLLSTEALYFYPEDKEPDFFEINGALHIEEVTEKDLRFANKCVHGSYFLKKCVFDEVGLYNDKYRFAQDYDLLIRIKNKGYKIGIINFPLYAYFLQINNPNIYKRYLFSLEIVGRKRWFHKGIFNSILELFFKISHYFRKKSLLKKGVYSILFKILGYIFYPSLIIKKVEEIIIKNL